MTGMHEFNLHLCTKRSLIAPQQSVWKWQRNSELQQDSVAGMDKYAMSESVKVKRKIDIS